MVIGGQAVLVYGEPRFTRDIDITLGAGIERLEEVLKLVDSFHWKVLAPLPPNSFKEPWFFRARTRKAACG